MISINDVKNAGKGFFPDGNIEEVEQILNGHINLTYRVRIDGRDYILQRINTDIFKDPDGLINNIASVTEYLRGIITKNGGDPDRETLTLLKTPKGEYLFRDDSGVYRMYLFITGATCYNRAERKGMFGESARAFGRFQNLLAGFDATKLNETIRFFHYTPKRYQNFINALEADRFGRSADCKDEIEFFRSRGDYCDTITKRLADGTIPTRATHNDTKLNNVMIDDATGKGICVIDLDTVMPGSMLYDFGDSIRFGASSAAEDEKDLAKVYCVPELYEEYANGFLSELKESITPAELEYLHDGAIMMTYECGMRFLTDYLEGDVYFRTSFEGQNLVRARTQMKLVRDMENRRALFEGIIKKAFEN
ncbi:MAG: aminoglycoside phosphotransferase family protein [Clostridia bacterium]|nr:aminoglycoside phosphotransferase family protein [Clostridia bacterium]